jgi:hypothetical protein
MRAALLMVMIKVKRGRENNRTNYMGHTAQLETPSKTDKKSCVSLEFKLSHFVWVY